MEKKIVASGIFCFLFCSFLALLVTIVVLQLKDRWKKNFVNTSGRSDSICSEIEMFQTYTRNKTGFMLGTIVDCPEHPFLTHPVKVKK